MEDLLKKIAEAHDQKTLVKCTLARPTPAAPEGLKNIFLRPVEIRKQAKISATFRFKNRDEVKNFTLAEILEKLAEWLPAHFLNADLMTTTGDFSVVCQSGDWRYCSKPASHTAPPTAAHNREKNRLLDPAAAWLHELGITSARGEVLPTQQDKWRQINKFLEIIDNLLGQMPDLPNAPRIADMGCGKGYLTFALFDFLKNKKGFSPKIWGIELRKPLVEFCNSVAQRVDFQGLEFVAADISDFQPDSLDLLIALHACDTATDLALAAGLKNRARAIVVAPCCHKQIRRDMATRNELAPAMRHGILEERQAEILTDSIRALLLEAEGYRTAVFEFISTEHTAKNVMITAVAGKTVDRAATLRQVAALKNGFGIRQHFLEKLLEKLGEKEFA